MIPPQETQKYVVQSGDNLTKIAKEKGVSVKELVAWNSIKNPDEIFAGQELLVSDPGRWKSDGEGGWIDTKTQELWQNKGSLISPNWVEVNFGDWLSQQKEKYGMSFCNWEEIEAYKEICVDLLFFANATYRVASPKYGNKTTPSQSVSRSSGKNVGNGTTPSASSGNAGQNVTNGAPKVHGNSLSSQRPTWGYRL